MYDLTFSELANHQIRHQATHKVGCQPGDCVLSLWSSSGVCVGMYGLTHSLYHPRGAFDHDCSCSSFFFKFQTVQHIVISGTYKIFSGSSVLQSMLWPPTKSFSKLMWSRIVFHPLHYKNWLFSLTLTLAVHGHSKCLKSQCISIIDGDTTQTWLTLLSLIASGLWNNELWFTLTYLRFVYNHYLPTTCFHLNTSLISLAHMIHKV